MCAISREFRRRPVAAYAAALGLFCVAAIMPVAWMLGQFLAGVLRDPGVLLETLLDGRQICLFGRSMGIAALATLLALLIGAPVAVVLAARDLPMRGFFFLLVAVPLLIPSYVSAGAWMHLFSPHGTINQALITAFGPAATIAIQSVPGCICCLGLSFFPIFSLILATGLGQLDGNLLDAARLCTHRWGVFRHAVLPQLRSHLAAATCLVLVFVLGQYGVPSLLGVNTYPVEIFAKFSAFYDEVGAVASAIPLTILAILLVLVQRRIMGSREYVSIAPRSDARAPVSLGRARPFGIGLLVVVFLLTVVLPFSSVLASARGAGNVLSTAWMFREAVGFTAVLALLASLVSALIAFFLAHPLAFQSGRMAGALDVLCWLPIAVPGTVVGLGIIRVRAALPLLERADSLGLFLLLAYVGIFSAFAIRVLHAAYMRADPNVEDAAAIDCPRWYQQCWHVDRRMHGGAIVVAVMLVFVLTLGELNATVLLAPPGRDTLSVSIDNLLHYGASATASAFCLVEAGLVLVVAIVTSGYLKIVGLRPARRGRAMRS